MKRQIARGVRDASVALRSGTTTTRSSAQAFICAECRRQLSGRPVRKPYITSQRQYSTSRRQQQQATASANSGAASSSSLPQTHYDFFPQTFPNGPPPASPFTPDLKQLRKEFLQLQAKAHPDLAPANQKRQAEALSSRVNEAYRALQDPLKRAQYLLLQQGMDVEDESAKMSGGPLLMEVMEAREAVDEVETEEDLVSIREENDARIAESVGALEALFANGDLHAAAAEAILQTFSYVPPHYQHNLPKYEL
ncbi:molecular chaperone [Recurvomyces mirabilis]|nr:molecular chaperone [Recurvomyces mirabilis]